MAATMKAWRLSAYGEGGDPAKAIATLKLEDVPAPTPGKGEVCVKVEYASVNPEPKPCALSRAPFSALTSEQHPNSDLYLSRARSLSL
jgi:NADPH-dependent curcumin reductase CurA